MRSVRRLRQQPCLPVPCEGDDDMRILQGFLGFSYGLWFGVLGLMPCESCKVTQVKTSYVRTEVSPSVSLLPQSVDMLVLQGHHDKLPVQMHACMRGCIQNRQTDR